jgi:eukaryotic-like serine/threonine-protein kinase
MTAAQEQRVVRARARVGSVLNGKYRLDRVLGVGGMAAVYSATHLRNASRIAVKLLHPEMAAEANVRRRFLREGYAANSVEHPGTVRILDDDTAEDGSVFLVMELLEGETLDHRWERSGHRLGAREVARLMYQVLEVLAAAHAKGIVHRDIKPENLFLTRGGTLKVLDFGVARLIEGPVTATREGTGIIGTPAFMAPEQVLGKAVDPQSDLYSVGATAFTLLSKRYVHDADNAAEMMVVVGSRPARSLALVSPDLPPALTVVVDRALRFEKSERWPDARSMMAALADAYQATFDAPMPGAEEAEETEGESPTPGTAERSSAGGGGRMSDRASSAVTVLTGATPVVTGIVEPLRGGFPTQQIRRWGPRALAGAGALATLAIGGLLAATAGGPSAPPAGSTQGSALPAAAIRHDLASDPSHSWSAPADIAIVAVDPPSVPVESLPAVGQPALKSTASPPPAVPAAVSPPPHPVPTHASSGCVPPFVVDPATGKKKWKLECL